MTKFGPMIVLTIALCLAIPVTAFGQECAEKDFECRIDQGRELSCETPETFETPETALTPDTPRALKHS